jgi:hypothetical protein
VSARPDRVSLAGGLGLIATGGLLWLDQAGSLELSLGVAGAVLAALVGLVLVLSGLGDDGD